MTSWLQVLDDLIWNDPTATLERKVVTATLERKVVTVKMSHSDAILFLENIPFPCTTELFLLHN